MILEPFAHMFRTLKSNNIHIQYVLDIGAYRGDFTETVKSVWPTAIVRQFEADDRQRSWLQHNAIIALLGDEEKESVNFYTLGEDNITTGSSIYKELTPYYNVTSTVKLKKPMTTIDILDKTYNFYGNWSMLGLVKIDTQGSELLILAGAKNFIEKKKPRYILLECSVKPYNLGAPMVGEVINRMLTLSYQVSNIVDLSYDNNGNLLQLNILFERTAL